MSAFLLLQGVETAGAIPRDDISDGGSENGAFGGAEALGQGRLGSVGLDRPDDADD